NAVANAAVPKFTLLFGASHGAGNYGMCGRAYSPRFLFSWPNSRISVMGGEQAAQTLLTVKLQQLEARGQTMTDAERDAFTAPTRAAVASPPHPPASGGGGGPRPPPPPGLGDAGTRDRVEPRDALALGIAAALNAPIPPTTFGVFRM